MFQLQKKLTHPLTKGVSRNVIDYASKEMGLGPTTVVKEETQPM